VRPEKKNPWLTWVVASGLGLLTVIGLIYLVSGPQTPVVRPTPPLAQTIPAATARPDPAPTTNQPAPQPQPAPTVDEPVLRLVQPGPQRIDEGTQLRLQLELLGPAASNNEARFVLRPGAPAGVHVDPQSGVLTWRPTEEQGPGRYAFDIAATSGQQSSVTTLAVEVAEVNEPPEITPISEQVVAPGVQFAIKVAASDKDQPAHTLSYELLNAPSGAKIDSSSGELTWTPTAEQAGQNFEAKVRVRDSAGGQSEAVIGLRVAGVVAGAKPAAGADGRLALPSEDQLQKATVQVQQLFAAELAKAGADPPARVALSAKLLQEAEGLKGDPVGRYALYRQAIQQARLTGKFAVAAQAIDALARVFAIDALEEKQATAVEMSKSVRAEEAATELVEGLLTVVGDAVAREDWERAASLARLAAAVAPKTRSADLRKTVTARGKEVAALGKLHAEHLQALQQLEQDPNQPAAQRIVGTYQALVLGNWEAGLPHLSTGDDAALADLSKKELAKPTVAAAMKEVAEGWASLLGKRGTSATIKLLDAFPLVRENVRQHSLKWYEAAMPGLGELERRAAEQQVAQLKADASPPKSAGRGGHKTSLAALDRTYGFHQQGPLVYPAYPNTKWFKATNNVHSAREKFYVITSDGMLRAWSAEGGPNYSDPIADVGVEAYANPALLLDAAR
jgi:hypothetical protein